jgi:Ca-activated chloride channel homolog
MDLIGGLKPLDPSRQLTFSLQGMKINATIVDSIVKVTLAQVFSSSSSSKSSTSCQYVLPLDEGAAVVGFRALVGSRTIEGVVKEAGMARQEYDAAVAAGMTAFLGEQNRPDIFAIAVGNIPPNTFVGVIISYVAPLTGVDARRLRWVVPTLIAPRYTPPEGDGAQPPLEVGSSSFSPGIQIQFRVYASPG